MSKPLDLSKPIQFRDPSRGTVISVLANPDGHADAKLIVNFTCDDIVYVTIRNEHGGGYRPETALVNVPEKKRFESDALSQLAVDLQQPLLRLSKDLSAAGDAAAAVASIIEHIVREIEV